MWGQKLADKLRMIGGSQVFKGLMKVGVKMNLRCEKTNQDQTVKHSSK